MEPGYAATLLPEKRLRALDAELASIESVLTALRYAEGDGRGFIPWTEPVSSLLCRQVCAALDLHASELDGVDIDPDVVRADMQGEMRVIQQLAAQRERLARVLALTDEVADAVGSDLMQVAMRWRILLREAGRADGITALQGRRRR